MGGHGVECPQNLVAIGPLPNYLRVSGRRGMLMVAVTVVVAVIVLVVVIVVVNSGGGFCSNILSHHPADIYMSVGFHSTLTI